MAELAGFDATAGCHALGERGDLSFYDGDAALGLRARRFQAGQHRPLLEIASHNSGSCCRAVEVPAALARPDLPSLLSEGWPEPLTRLRP
ncbi:hypothetical protein [Agrobacterium tumefaciens]|uniref:hypothetical protein n=1 Tax=Agrobacterium tumefaciens TaxID=358 RepID=UPI001297BE77|nr:hypothetical protein [Agrobacterium tumefaciens]